MEAPTGRTAVFENSASWDSGSNRCPCWWLPLLAGPGPLLARPPVTIWYTTRRFFNHSVINPKWASKANLFFSQSINFFKVGGIPSCHYRFMVISSHIPSRTFNQLNRPHPNERGNLYCLDYETAECQIKKTKQIWCWQLPPYLYLSIRVFRVRDLHSRLS